MKPGRFITLEGIDGAGKSTHLAWIESHLRGLGIPVVVTREPGGTVLGERLRELLLNHPMHPETEALLMFAARREHLEQVIQPALARGDWVISDRFTDASFAYQCGGRGVPEAKLEILEQWVHGGFQPDLTLLFDVSVEVARSRLPRGAGLDRFEQEQDLFFSAVRSAYLRRAERYPERIRLICSSGTLENVKKELESIITTFCAI